MGLFDALPGFWKQPVPDGYVRARHCLFLGTDEATKEAAGHAFHDACLRKWAKYKCPSCRGNYGEADVRPAVRSVTGARAVEATKLDAFLEDAQQASAQAPEASDARRARPRTCWVF